MTTNTSDKLALTVTRFINASPEKVYRAWTDPAQLKMWFGPEGVQTRNFTAEPRVGGSYRWDLTSPEGEKMAAHGQYRELQPDKRIVFTWQWEDDEDWANCMSIVTVTLSPRDGGTDVRLTHEQLPSEASRDRHSVGWDKVLDALLSFSER